MIGSGIVVMILNANELSPDQKAAIEHLIGRRVPRGSSDRLLQSLGNFRGAPVVVRQFRKNPEQFGPACSNLVVARMLMRARLLRHITDAWLIRFRWHEL
jgi:hypothetical protein